MARAAAVRVVHGLAAPVEEREVIDALAVRQPQRLAGLELGERLDPTALPRDHAAAQA